jgi:hypothetical protein
MHAAFRAMSESCCHHTSLLAARLRGRVPRYGEEDRYDRREREGKTKGGKLGRSVGTGQGISLVAHRRLKTQGVTLRKFWVPGARMDVGVKGCVLFASGRMGNSISETNASAA